MSIKVFSLKGKIDSTSTPSITHVKVLKPDWDDVVSKGPMFNEYEKIFKQKKSE